MVKTIRFLSHYKRTAETSYEISAAKVIWVYSTLSPVQGGDKMINQLM